VPDTPHLVVAAALLLAGVALLVVAALGGRGRLPRNRFAGVRTAATLRSQEQFALANRVAAAPLGAAGAVGVAGGGAALLAGSGTAGWVLVALAGIGVLVLAGIGGALGDRAAATHPASTARPPACSGTCAGCDLVAGCRTSAPTGSAASEPCP